MTTLLFPHRDAEHYAPRIRARFPQIRLFAAHDVSGMADAFEDADILIASPTDFRRELIASAKHLRWIQTMTTGTDAVLALGPLIKDVVVTSTRGIHGPQMSEMALMHMMAVARNFAGFVEQKKKGVWERWTQMRLCGKTVVIIGVGLIAESLAPRCKALGMTVVGVTGSPRAVPGFDRTIHRSALLEAAAQADFIVLLAPYTPENDNLIDARVLGVMKRTAIIVNIARGGLIDEDALLVALRERRIGGAGLDAFRNEPLPPDSPFWKLDNVFITPHCSGSSDDNVDLTWPIIETNTQCVLDGRFSDMLNVVPH